MNTFLHSSDCYHFLKVALCKDPGVEATCGSIGFPTCTTQCSNHFPITNSSLALWCRFVWLKMWKIVAKKRTNNITLIKDSHLLSQLKVTYPVLNLRGAVGKLLRALIPRPFGSTLSSGQIGIFDPPTLSSGHTRLLIHPLFFFLIESWDIIGPYISLHSQIRLSPVFEILSPPKISNLLTFQNIPDYCHAWVLPYWSMLRNYHSEASWWKSFSVYVVIFFCEIHIINIDNIIIWFLLL